MYAVKVNDKVVSRCNLFHINGFAGTRSTVHNVNAFVETGTETVVRIVVAIVAYNLDIVGVKRDAWVVDVIERQFFNVVRAQIADVKDAAAPCASAAAFHLERD